MHRPSAAPQREETHKHGALQHEHAATHRDLDLLFGQVAALHDLAARIDDPAEASAAVYDFSIRWGTFLAGRLHRLEHYHALGELAPDEAERYDALLARLREALPVLERLGLARPHPVTGRRRAGAP